MGRKRASGGQGISIARKISRREFLRVSGAGLTGAALLLGGVGCDGDGGQGNSGELVFSFFPDPSGSVRALVDQFNEENEGNISVALREMLADSGQHFGQLNTEFQSGEIGIDVLGGRDLAGAVRGQRLHSRSLRAFLRGGAG